MDKMNRLLEIARDQPKIFKVRIVAAIYRKNRLISYGFNSSKTHPFQKRWAAHPEALYTHAEVDAIRNALRRGADLTRCSIYVARWTDQGPACAKPCNGCQEAIRAFGIRRTYWSLDKGRIGASVK